MNKNQAYWAMCLGAASAAAILARPSNDRSMKKAMKNMRKLVNNVSDVMGW